MAIYKPPKYSDKKYKNNIDTSFYTKAINKYKKQANVDRTKQINEAQATRTQQLREAYVNKLQSQQALGDAMAQQGIRGGVTESSQLAIGNQYGQARNSAYANFGQARNTINNNYNQNVADYTADMQARAEEYKQNMAQAKWQADREDSLNKYNAQNEFWNNYYADYYSGYGKDNLDKALKEAQSNYKKAKTSEGKQRYLQQIRGIQARKGVIAANEAAKK